MSSSFECGEDSSAKPRREAIPHGAGL
jgi:hypothetical protein